jgi:5-methylcytosine-specific restriction endonuclease McrA
VSTSRIKKGGWVKRERRPCRWCGGEVPKRRLTFCSEECVDQWKLRTDPAFLRAVVFERDHGVCALCGLDTEQLRRDKRKLDYAARKAFEREWGSRLHFWDADHVIPVAEGGGECGLSNMRTLCLKCHRSVSAELRKRLAARRSAKTDSGLVRERPLAPAMRGKSAEELPGKKAHKPRPGLAGAKSSEVQARKAAKANTPPPETLHYK